MDVETEGTRPVRSNLKHWLALHEAGYYAKHPYYADRSKAPQGDLSMIEFFFRLRPEFTVAVIGSGYGREIAEIAPRVSRVYAIDVGEPVFGLMHEYLRPKGISNVVPVLAESWREDLPAGIDFVYSFVTFQHLTRDLVEDYILGLPAKFAPAGHGLVQFSESPTGSFDAPDEDVEPNVRWHVSEIKDLFRRAGLSIYRLNTTNGHAGRRSIRPYTWHWVYFGNRRIE